jgi:hypothetical protein
MADMRRISIAVAASVTALALILPAVAPATITEVGVIATTTPATVPSCPGSPCLAVSRTTGFQVKVGSERNLESAPKAGTIVAWTISLGNPNATQIKFFNTNEGGPSEAGIAVLAPQRKPNLTYKLVASSPMIKLQPYFGKKGDVVALTVPSWAPALALGFANTTSWRASRPKSGCTSTSSQTVQTEVASAVQYYCLYQTARLTYSATMISTP